MHSSAFNAKINLVRLFTDTRIKLISTSPSVLRNLSGEFSKKKNLSRN